MRLTYWQRAVLSIATAVVVLTVFQFVVFGNTSISEWSTSFAAILVGVGGTYYLLRHRAQ